MDKKISSEARLLCVFLGVVWVSIFGVLFVLGFIFENLFFTYVGLIAAILGACIFIWLFVRSSVIAKITPQGLYLGFFKKNCLVPYSNIKSISGGWVGPFCFPHEIFVKVQFYKSTIFGSRIKFIPAIDLDSYASAYIPLSFKRKQNVVVNELQNIIDHNELIAKQKPGADGGKVVVLR
jgi:hypothetical protein